MKRRTGEAGKRGTGARASDEVHLSFGPPRPGDVTLVFETSESHAKTPARNESIVVRWTGAFVLTMRIDTDAVIKALRDPLQKALDHGWLTVR